MSLVGPRVIAVAAKNGPDTFHLCYFSKHAG